jgi:serine/threonine protein kinase
MIKALSYFVVNRHTPHIVLPIATFNTNIAPFINLTTSGTIVNNKKYEQFVSKYKKGEYYDYVSILISEWANGGDLLDYIRNNYKNLKTKHWKVIFFQVLSTLAVIHEKYPEFRHNDLKANNILVHYIELDPETKHLNKYKYKINEHEFIVPNLGFQLKIWDFDFASIPGIVDNAKVCAKWTQQINVTPKGNRYYDIHYLCNTLIRKEFFPNYNDDGAVPNDVKEFISRVVPEKYVKGKYVAERGRILINKEYTTPLKLLNKDPFFEEFRIVKKIGMNINKI